MFHDFVHLLPNSLIFDLALYSFDC